MAEAATGSIHWGGLTRTYLLHVPPSHDRTKPAPLVIVLHGGSGQGKDMVRLTFGQFDALSDRDGVVVVYPDGIEKNWNDGRNVQRFRSHRENIDDVGFVSALIDTLSRELNIDKRRVYATGISNGAIFSYRLACELTGKIAAIATVDGSMAEGSPARCSPSRPMPLLAINSTQDPLLPYLGGDIKSFGIHLGRVVPVPATIRFWVGHNGCPEQPQVAPVPTRVADGTSVRREAYGGCKAGSKVVVYTFEGAGHTWPGGLQYLPELVVGKTSKNLDATAIIWDFFKQQAP